MPDNTIRLLSEYLEKMKNVSNREELKTLNNEYKDLFFSSGEDDELGSLKTRIYAIISELITLREERRNKTIRSSTDLSETEHYEILRVQKIIDFNLFTYHFQPIVRVDNGEIYSYEALMRAKDMPDITPFHILKYAEMTDRLSEVEKYTFLNVLNYIKENKELFDGRLVFINSMPNVHIDPAVSNDIGELLGLLSDKVVVEMTEDSEFNDAELNDIKEKYRGLNIRIAIDDYGTGYSNISNLLRYTPNYVKIDRSLLSGIENSPNKKHFVREIIEFCHENNIMALAEGVESTEELRTVILLGADLIQGFYTARPSADIIPSIPYEIRAEIRAHRQEREDGKRLRVYNAERSERVLLDKLIKEGFDCIRIGIDYHDGNVTVAGNPNLDSNIHIDIAENFSGRLVLDTASLSNTNDRPAIDIGANSNVTIALAGNNRLSNSGIRVPETSVLRLEGNGNIDIKLSGADYYGIGNDMGSLHGDLIFDQDGTVSIFSDSHEGACIGSGLGGRIDIRRGRYILKSLGSIGVCIGAVNGSTKIDMVGCDIETVTSGAHCTAIGSVNGDADINTVYSSIKCSVGGILAAALGTVMGESADIRAESTNIRIDARAEQAVLFGSLYRDSHIRISRASSTVSAEGEKVVVFGGVNGVAELVLKAYDIAATILSEITTCYIHGVGEPVVEGGRFRFVINGKEYNELR
ncbi:MAG: EAL domain-containing protein [Ruminiclostridium sp.]|nr:EAL domain-containing protein [Ruminiclostridium sp.]